jgi:hypothetical protein
MNVRRALFSIIMALVLIAPFAPVRADVVLRGADRVDPCQQMLFWQDQMTKDPSLWSSMADLDLNYANACARTYDWFHNPGATCDAYLVAASAADVVVKRWWMRAPPRQMAIFLVDAIYAYSSAYSTCKLAHRPQILVDALEAASNKETDALDSLLKAP